MDRENVGRCVSRTRDIIEPEIPHRLDNLVNIGIDETSYKKGHKYITVIVNHDTNTVVWAALGHGKSVLEQFYTAAKQDATIGRILAILQAQWEEFFALSLHSEGSPVRDAWN